MLAEADDLLAVGPVMPCTTVSTLHQLSARQKLLHPTEQVAGQAFGPSNDATGQAVLPWDQGSSLALVV